MRELCWNITTKCNQNCGYCLRFMNLTELSLKQNLKILTNLAECGIEELTWGGGEPMLYPHISQLIRTAHSLGIKNKVVSNGILLTYNRIDDIAGALDTLTLSLDSTNSKTNDVIGRGARHFENVASIIAHIKEQGYPIKLKINTVACSYNLGDFDKLIEFVDNNVDFWRIFKMMPVRERAVINYSKFQISKESFEKKKKKVLQRTKKCKLSFRESSDMETKYFLLVANGDIFCTEKGIDIRKGNALDLEVLKKELVKGR